MRYALNDGTILPAIGFGTHPLRGRTAVDAVRHALHLGYRLIDTAAAYENERDVGEAIRSTGTRREDVFVVSKLPGNAHAYDDALASVHSSPERLGLDYLDMHLIHWPSPSRGQYIEAWLALVDLREQGLVRSVGVSNFTAIHLQRIIEDSGVTPAVNQIELHPHFPQAQMRSLHERPGIRTLSWSPLGKEQAPFTEPSVAQPAQAIM